MKRENQRIFLTKRLLKEGLIALLKEKGIYQLSISELCQRAGINRTTFYRYYGSQFDLLTEIEGDTLNRITDMLTNRASDSAQMLTSILTYIEENIDLFRLLIDNNVDPEFPNKLFSLEPIRQTLWATLYPKFPKEDIEYVSTFAIYGSYYLLREWLNKEDRDPPERVAVLVADLAGFAAREAADDAGHNSFTTEEEVP